MVNPNVISFNRAVVDNFATHKESGVSIHRHSPLDNYVSSKEGANGTLQCLGFRYNDMPTRYASDMCAIDEEVFLRDNRQVALERASVLLARIRAENGDATVRRTILGRVRDYFLARTSIIGRHRECRQNAACWNKVTTYIEIAEMFRRAVSQP